MKKTFLLLIILFISGCGVFNEPNDYDKYPEIYIPRQNYERSFINFGGGVDFHFHPDLSNISVALPSGIK